MKRVLDYSDPKGEGGDEKSEDESVTNSENGDSEVTLKKECWVVLGADQILLSSQNV